MNKILLFIILITTFGLSKSYTIDRIRIQAEVLKNGSIQIIEDRTYTFDGEFSWADYQLPLDKLGEVKLFSLREGSQNYYENSDESPGSYIIENRNDALYVKWFYQAEDQTRTFTLKYLATDAIKVYSDVAELYYKFIGETNQKNIGYVDVNIKLPNFASKDSVEIWLHAPLHGIINFVDGNVNLSIDQMPAEQYFESRIVFPAAWVPFSQKRFENNQLDKIINEETVWAEEANKTRLKTKEELRIQKEKEEQALPYSIALSIASILIVFFLFRKYGKAFKVAYDLKIDSTIPTNIHPAILSCLYFNKQVYGSAISTTIFDLARRDILAIEQIQPEDKKWWQPKKQYIFKLNRIGWNEIRNQMKDFENDMLEFFFNELAKGTDTINTLEFKKSSSKMRKWFEQWKKMVKAHVKHIPLYDKKSKRYTTYAAIFSAMVFTAGLLTLIFLGKPGIIIFVSGMICFALSFAILRYTEDIKLKRMQWEALKNYLKKYHFNNETDLNWQSRIGEYLVYGLALGVGKKAIEKMIITVPPDRHHSYFPWYIYAHGTPSSPADFASAITSVVTAASSTISSAAGAGGGASGGGGGGAGGAAGGAG